MSRPPPREVTVQTHAVPRPSAAAQGWRAGAPAAGAVLAKLAELCARSLRVELARRAKNAVRLGRALKRLPP